MKKKSQQCPTEARDFGKRFPTPASYAAYLRGESHNLHVLAYHKDAPLAGTRVFFLTIRATRSNALAFNMNNVKKLGKTVRRSLIPYQREKGNAKGSKSISFVLKNMTPT